MSWVPARAKLLDTLEDFFSKKAEKLTLGDFNSPAIDWQASSCSDYLLEFAEMGHLFQGITFPTRLRAGTSPSVLDLAFFSVPDAFLSDSRLSPLGLSDHAVVKILIKWKTPSWSLVIYL